MTVSSGTRKAWRPIVWPPDGPTAAALREWLEGDIEADFYGLDLDFSGSDLSGGDLLETWLSGSRFTGALLRSTTFVRAHLEEADFTGADLAGANLAKAEGKKAVLRDARLLGANLTASQFRAADLTGADLTAATLGDATFSGATLAGANLTNATANRLALRETVFDSAEVTGFSGSVVGPISVVFRGERTLLDDEDLERWFAARGAKITRFHAEKPA
ncbi:MAG TPA: pentapeptide repeat-containing protein [Actinophytocola sp.]|nr:pentapeptide repeat-containing protein [Actinophytocola sp.]